MVTFTLIPYRSFKGIFALFLILFSHYALFSQEDGRFERLDSNIKEELIYQLLAHADSGNYYEAKIILDYGVSPNASTWDGVTALMYASQGGNYFLARELISMGADLNLKSRSGITALHTAARANHDSIAELLILNGAEVNAIDGNKVSALHLSSAYGYPFMTHLLLHYKAEIDIQDGYGNTPLMLSVYSGSVMAAEILLDNWADVDISDNQNFTPLMVAAQYNDTLMIRLLTNYGADLHKRNSDGATALAIAMANRANEAIELLIELGAGKDELHPKTSYADFALALGMPEIYNTLQNNDDRFFSKPKLSSLTPYSGIIVSHNDLYCLLGLKALYANQGIQLSFDAGIRPYHKAVLEKDNYISYQFREKRKFVSVSVEKLIPLKYLPHGKRFGFHIGAKGIYSWGNYRYPQAKTFPKSYRLLSPSLGFYYQKGPLNFATQGYILRFDHLGQFPYAVDFTIGYSFISTKPKIRTKSVPWY